MCDIVAKFYRTLLMQVDQPLVSIVTINWNSLPVTMELLQSVKEQNAYKNIEVIVVDNFSEEDPTPTLKKFFPDTVVIRNKKNLGFSGGNNVGIKVAKGDFIFILNNDTEVTPNLISYLLQPFFDNIEVGVVCPKIRFFHNPKVIQYAGFKPINIFTGRTAAIGNKEEDNGQFDKPGFTEGAHGCAMMIRKDVIEKAGLLPEAFFLYYEEWDWSFRVIKAGYKIYYQSKALIYHKESMTVGKKNPIKTYYQTRNRILFMRRNVSSSAFLVFICFFIVFTIPKSIILYVIRGDFNHLQSFLKGVVDNTRISKHFLTCPFLII